MTKKETTQISYIANSRFAKSRYYKSSWINRTTGELINLPKIIELTTAIYKASFDTNFIASKNIDELKSIFNSLDYLSKTELDNLNKQNPFRFFEDYFLGRYETKVSCRHCFALFQQYNNKFMYEKGFYASLKFWAAENGLKIRFYNRLENRKVFIVV